MATKEKKAEVTVGLAVAKPTPLGPKALLRVINDETRERASIDIIAAIGALGPKAATVSAVLDAAAVRLGEGGSAPRSLEAKSDPVRFLRGYLTALVRRGNVGVSPPA